jgi:hypothetical protein
MPPQDINNLYKGFGQEIDAHYGNAGGEVPTGPRKILHDIIKEIDSDNLNTTTIQNVDKRLADFAGEARVSGRHNEANFAEKLRDQLEYNAGKHVPQEVADQLAIAKAAKRQESATFGSGTGQLNKVIDPKRYGFDKIKDAEFIKKLVTPGTPGQTLGVELKAAVGEEKATRIVAEEMRRLVQNGSISTAAHLQKYEPLFEEFTGLADKVKAVVGQRTANKLGLQAAGTTRKQILAAQEAANKVALAEQRATNKAAVATQKAADKQALGQHKVASAEDIAKEQQALKKFTASPLGKTAGETTNPGQVISGMVKTGDEAGPLNKLIRQVADEGDPDAMAGVRRALSDHIGTTSATSSVTARGNTIHDPAKSAEAIQAVLDSGGAALTAEQKQVLAQLQKEHQGAKFASDQGVLAKSYNNPNIPGVSGIAARTLKWAFTQFGNQKSMDALLIKAIRDPEFALELLKRPTKVRRRNIGRTIRQAVRATAPQAFLPANEGDNGPGIYGSVTDTRPRMIPDEEQ